MAGGKLQILLLQSHAQQVYFITPIQLIPISHCLIRFSLVIFSIWGKLAQRVSGHVETKFVSKWSELEAILE